MKRIVGGNGCRRVPFEGIEYMHRYFFSEPLAERSRDEKSRAAAIRPDFRHRAGNIDQVPHRQREESRIRTELETGLAAGLFDGPRDPALGIARPPLLRHPRRAGLDVDVT